MTFLKPDKDSAQVRVPPPLAGLICLSGGLYLHWRWPIAIVAEDIRYKVGVFVFLLGFSILLTCARGFKKLGTNLPPWMPTLSIKTNGLYRFSRNPIYSAFFLIGSGLGLIINTLWIFICLIPLFWFLNFYVIPREEKYLEAKFGPVYLDYKNRVRRWF